MLIKFGEKEYEAIVSLIQLLESEMVEIPENDFEVIKNLLNHYDEMKKKNEEDDKLPGMVISLLKRNPDISRRQAMIIAKEMLSEND